MDTLPDVVLLAALIIGGTVFLWLMLKILVDRQNRQTLSDRADARLQAMLLAGELLQELAEDPSVPEPQRRRAARVAQDYPESDQLRGFADYLAAQLNRGQCRATHKS